MMVTFPIFLPVVHALGFDPVWWGLITLINLEMGMTTPPFGLLLFVMKGSAPAGTTLWDIAKAAIPFLCCDLIVMILLISFPKVVTFLPNLM